jgi:hypothetical protein
MRINNRYTGHVLPDNANDAKVAKRGGNIAGRRLIFDGFPPVIYSLRTFFYMSPLYWEEEEKRK